MLDTRACVLVSGGRRIPLGEPRLYRDPRRRDVPRIVGLALGVIGVSDFLELRRS